MARHMRAWRKKIIARFRADIHAKSEDVRRDWQVALRAAVRADIPDLESYASLPKLREALGWEKGVSPPRYYDPVSKRSYVVANLPATKTTSKAAKPRKAPEARTIPLTKQQEQFALTPGLQNLAEVFAEQASCIKGLYALTVILCKDKKFKFRYKVRQSPLVFEFDQVAA